jgi:hypothetical protein
MAVPVVESVTVSKTTTESTTRTMNMPATRPAGDIYVCCIAGGTTASLTAPAGWTQLETTETPTGTGRFSIWSHTGGASEPSSYDFTGSLAKVSVGSIIRISGAEEVPDIVGAWGTGENSNDCVSPAVTVTVDDTLVLRFATRHVTNANDLITATPTTEAFIDDTDGTATGNMSAAASYAAGPASGNSTGTAAFTDAGGFSQWAAITIAFEPSAGGDEVLSPADLSFSLSEDAGTVAQSGFAVSPADLGLSLSEDEATVAQSTFSVAPSDIALELTSDVGTVEQSGFVVAPAELAFDLQADATTLEVDRVVAPSDIAFELTSDVGAVAQSTFAVAPDGLDLSLSEDGSTIAQSTFSVDPVEISFALSEDVSTVAQAEFIVAPSEISFSLSEDGATVAQSSFSVAPDGLDFALSEDVGTSAQTTFSVSPADLAFSVLADAGSVTQGEFIVAPVDLSFSLATTTPIARKLEIPYSPINLWNQTIAESAAQSALHSTYQTKWATLQPNPQNFNLTPFDWDYTFPVYYLDEANDTYSVIATYGNMDGLDIPWNSEWNAPPGTDAQIVLLDPSTGAEYNAWQVTVNHGAKTLTCTRCNRINVESDEYSLGTIQSYIDAVNTWGHSRGVGIPYRAMLITPDEIASGVIEHAITGVFASTVTGTTFVAPAKKTDGFTVGGIPEGVRFYFDITDTDITNTVARAAAQGLSAANQNFFAIILRAMRDYGVICTDKGGLSYCAQTEHYHSAATQWAELGLEDEDLSDGKAFPRDGLDYLWAEYGGWSSFEPQMIWVDPVYTVEPDDLSLSLASDTPSLGEDESLVPANLAFGLTVDAGSVAQGTFTLSPVEISFALTSESGSLTQNTFLVAPNDLRLVSVFDTASVLLPGMETKSKLQPMMMLSIGRMMS